MRQQSLQVHKLEGLAAWSRSWRFSMPVQILWKTPEHEVQGTWGCVVRMVFLHLVHLVPGAVLGAEVVSDEGVESASGLAKMSLHVMHIQEPGVFAAESLPALVGMLVQVLWNTLVQAPHET